MDDIYDTRALFASSEDEDDDNKGKKPDASDDKADDSSKDDDDDDDHEEEEEEEEPGEGEDDARKGESAEGADEGDKGDPGEGEEDDTDKAREARRQAKRERRQRAKEARERDRALIESLTTQVSNFERRFADLDKRGSANDLAQLDASIVAHEQAYNQVSERLQQVMGKDPKATVQAMDARDQIRDRLMSMKSHRERLARFETQQQRPTVNPVVINHAKKFAEDHKWYDPMAKDEDSRIVMAIDAALTNEGFMPETEGYWRELRTRVKRRLPGRFEKSDRQQGKGGERPRLKGKPPSGGGTQRGGVQGSKPVVLSKAREEAMLQAGLKRGSKGWAEQVKAYLSYDKQHKGR